MSCKLCNKFKKKYPLQIKNDECGVNKFHNLGNGIFKSEINCAFDNNGEFKHNNWACETMLMLRVISQKYITSSHFEESVSIIPIPENDCQNGFLVFSWYKSRGKTGEAVVIDSDGHQNLKLETAEAIILNEVD